MESFSLIRVSAIQQSVQYVIEGHIAFPIFDILAHHVLFWFLLFVVGVVA
jgi:hypothetical protein